MSTVYFINHYIDNISINITINQYDMIKVNAVWDTTDELLEDLQKTKEFEECVTWNELTVEHWQFLVSKCLINYFKLTNPEKQNKENNTVNSLYFFLTALIKKWEQETYCSVASISLDIFNDNMIKFNYNSVTLIDIGTK